MARLTIEEERAREYALMRYEREYDSEGLIAGVDDHLHVLLLQVLLPLSYFIPERRFWGSMIRKS